MRAGRLALLVLLATAPAIACRAESAPTISPSAAPIEATAEPTAQATVDATATPSTNPFETVPIRSPSAAPSSTPATPRPIMTAEPGMSGPRGSVIADAPIAARFGHAAAWTDGEVVIVGGQRDYDSVPFDDGAAYDPKTGNWRTIASFPLGPRTGATALWTGSEVIVWGGNASGDGPVSLGEGAAYDPVADTWRPMALPRGELTADVWYETVWTGDEMIIWGGRRGGDSAAVGAAYDPRTDQWRDLPAAPLTPRFGHSIVWTGTEVIVWGGRATDDSEQPLGDGAAYDPQTNSWRVIAPGPLEPRSDHIAVWTDARYATNEMLVWTGRGESGDFLPSAATYDPRRDTWRLIDTPEIAPRVDATAVWTGREAIVWGGVDQPPPGCHEGARDDNPYAACDGITFTPAAANRLGQWYEILPGPLSVRTGHSAVWAGDVMVIWGGIDRDERALADGAVYDPQIYWLSAPLAPTERAESDRFWQWLIPMQCPGSPEWHSLRAMAADADVVVRGRVVAVEGRFDRRYNTPTAVITFEVTELLKGELTSLVEGTVDLVSYEADGNDWSLKSNTPGGEHLLFLVPATEGDWYYLPNYQAVLRELNGRVELFSGQGGTEFLHELNGLQFDDVVDKVRQVVTAMGAGGRLRTEQPAQRTLFAC